MNRDERLDGLSVIICCYNSANRIVETLEHLQRQKVPADFGWEIIVVNNASKDRTREICQDFFKTNFQGRVARVIDEENPGQAFARKTGIRNAKFDIIIFCDDDNHLDENYLMQAWTLMERRSEIAIAGGMIKPKFERYPGKWIEGNYAALAVGEIAERDGYVTWVFGAGMVVRRCVYDLLEKKGIQFYLSGRVGKKQTSGDDAEICQLARFLGLKVYYSSSLVLHHKIDQKRLSKRSFIRANYRNVFMVVYFFILDRLIQNSASAPDQMYRAFFLSRVSKVFYYLPRIVFGKYRFFSFMMFFQNIQLVAWLLMRRRSFMETVNSVRENLYHEK